VRGDQWLDRSAGPVVRPYALTGGRTRPTGETIDLLALVASTGALVDEFLLEPEYLAVLRQCRQPTPVADLASDLDLPLGVVRILLSDMREQGLVVIRPPLRNRLSDPKLLKDVADALRKL
jgi:DNA-binding transcriptional ArsR family regulator